MVKASGASAVVDLFPKDLLLSIKPEYASAIMAGRKTVELRRKFPEDVAPGSRAYIYSSSPVQAVIGIATVDRVDRMPLDILWKKHGQASCIDRLTFNEYFVGQADGCAVVLKSVKALAHPIARDALKATLGIVPPQSFMYLPAEFEKKFANGST
jgi:predicted transcriptional regulator